MLSDLSIGLLRHIALLKTTLQTLHSLVKSKYMLVEHFGIFECLSALGTLEGLVAIVEDMLVEVLNYSNKTFQCSQCTRTLEGLVAIVEDMLVEVLGTRENLLALMTHEIVLLAVYLHVDVESVGVCEHLVADMTCLKTLSCVYPHVIFQLLFFAEDNVTYRTRLSLLSCMCSLMGVAGTLKYLAVRI